MGVGKFEKQMRVQRAKELMAQTGTWSNITICMTLMKEYSVHRTVACRYIALAKKQMLALTQKRADEHVAELTNHYNEIIANNTDDKIRLKAMDQKTKLLGLNPVPALNLNFTKPKVDSDEQKELLTNPELQIAVTAVDKLLNE